MLAQKTRHIGKVFLLFGVFVLVIYGWKEKKVMDRENEKIVWRGNCEFWKIMSPLEKYMQLSDGHVSFSSCITALFDDISPLYNYTVELISIEVAGLETEQDKMHEGNESCSVDDKNTYVDSLLNEQSSKTIDVDKQNYDIEHVDFTDFTNSVIEEKNDLDGNVLLPTNSTKIEINKEFMPKNTKVLEYDLSKMKNKDYLIQNFYVVDSGTTAPTDLLDIDKLLGQDMTIDKNMAGPQILIYHTHSQEGYADTVEGNTDTTIVGMGELLKKILEDEYGYKVLHHLGKYDTVKHDYAYSYALPEISRILEENPSIQVVIDLHRDEVAADKKLVVNQDGKDMAQFMFFNGVSYINGKGKLDSLQNPNLQSNLAFSFQMQKTAGEFYPGLVRRIYLKGYRYNMHLSSKYLLVELGAQTNTVEEARNACYPLADVLDKVIGEDR